MILTVFIVSIREDFKMTSGTFRRGDLFAHLDCDDCVDFIKGMPDECVDLVVADPPYGIGYRTNYRIDSRHDFCGVSSSVAVRRNQKPVPLLQRCIESFSDAGQFVFDPFAGSASTAIAVLNAGRNFGGVELDGNEYDKAVSGLEVYCK